MDQNQGDLHSLGNIWLKPVLQFTGKVSKYSVISSFILSGPLILALPWLEAVTLKTAHMKLYMY